VYSAPGTGIPADISHGQVLADEATKRLDDGSHQRSEQCVRLSDTRPVRRAISNSGTEFHTGTWFPLTGTAFPPLVEFFPTYVLHCAVGFPLDPAEMMHSVSCIVRAISITLNVERTNVHELSATPRNGLASVQLRLYARVSARSL
jgi:hypothetical protein